MNSGEHAMVKRIAKLWGVAPYRVEVKHVGYNALGLTLDGSPPTEEQVAVVHQDIREVTSKVLAAIRMNVN